MKYQGEPQRMSLVRNVVFEQVRREILSCELAPGEELRESELAKRYGVSKSPVRDAMQKLEFEGLIEIEPRRGHRVKPISVADAVDILELRLILETAAVRKIAQEATGKALDSLDAFRTADRTSLEAFTVYNRNFHQFLGALAGNRRLEDETRRLMEMYDRICIVSLSNKRGPDSLAEPLADHIAIIDALQARDGAKAARLVKRHVDRSRSSVLRGLDRRPIIE